jgi:hypothetical protein
MNARAAGEGDLPASQTHSTPHEQGRRVDLEHDEFAAFRQLLAWSRLRNRRSCPIRYHKPPARRQFHRGGSTMSGPSAI